MRKIWTALISLVFILQVSCEKVPIAPLEDFRITSIDFVPDEGIEGESKEVFEYEGQKLVSKKKYYKGENDSWELTYISEILYESNMAICYDSFMSNGQINALTKSEYTLEGDKIIRKYYHGIFAFSNYQIDYEYEGNDMVSYTFFSPDSDNKMVAWRKSIMRYYGGKVQSHENFDVNSDGTYGESFTRTEFYYRGGLLDYYVEKARLNDGTWMNAIRKNYVYSGDNVTKIISNEWFPDKDQWSDNNSVTGNYIYDDDGNQMEEILPNARIIYTYEQGKGNARLFFTDPTEWMYQEPGIK